MLPGDRIDRKTVVAAARREDRRVRVYSLNMDEEAEFDLGAPGVRHRGLWCGRVEQKGACKNVLTVTRPRQAGVSGGR